MDSPYVAPLLRPAIHHASVLVDAIQGAEGVVGVDRTCGAAVVVAAALQLGPRRPGCLSSKSKVCSDLAKALSAAGAECPSQKWACPALAAHSVQSCGTRRQVSVSLVLVWSPSIGQEHLDIQVDATPRPDW